MLVFSPTKFQLDDFLTKKKNLQLSAVVNQKWKQNRNIRYLLYPKHPFVLLGLKFSRGDLNFCASVGAHTTISSVMNF